MQNLWRKLWIKICTGPRQVANAPPTGVGQALDGYKGLIISKISVLYSNVCAVIIIVIILIQEFKI